MVDFNLNDGNNWSGITPIHPETPHNFNSDNEIVSFARLWCCLVQLVEGILEGILEKMIRSDIYFLHFVEKISADVHVTWTHVQQCALILKVDKQ